METNLKLTVKAERNMFGKASGGYRATVGDFSFCGKTREQAVELLTDRMAQLYRHSFTRRYLTTPKGVVFALSYAWGGWCYDIVRGDTASTCCMSCETEQDAYGAMHKHYMQMCDDENLIAA